MKKIAYYTSSMCNFGLFFFFWGGGVGGGVKY